MVTQLFFKMIKAIKKIVFNYRFKKSVKQAREAEEATGRKHFVILFKGKPIVITKQRITHWVRTRKFAKGVTVADIEKQALFTTAPKFYTPKTNQNVSKR